MRRVLATSALCVLWLSAGCASTAVPVAGENTAPPVREVDDERLFEEAKRVEASLLRSRMLLQDATLEAYLSGVANGLIPPEIKATGVTVRVRVIRPLLPPNAFVLPNGTIYVHSRMLALMDNEAQLAAILGHELVHFINRHLVRARREALSRAALSHLLNSVLSSVAFGLLAPSSAEMAELFSLAAIRGYSRELEAEADIVGFKLVVEAGYDPAEIPKIFETLQREQPSEEREEFFYASATKLRERLADAKTLLESRHANRGPEAVRRVGRDEFERAISGLLLENASLELRSNRFQDARRSIDRHLLTSPTSARGHFLLGEWWRLKGEDREALEAYEVSIHYDPRLPEPRRELGLLLRKLGRLEAAGAELRRYLELAPHAPDAPIIVRYMSGLPSSPVGAP